MLAESCKHASSLYHLDLARATAELGSHLIPNRHSRASWICVMCSFSCAISASQAMQTSCAQFPICAGGQSSPLARPLLMPGRNTKSHEPTKQMACMALICAPNPKNPTLKPSTPNPKNPQPYANPKTLNPEPQKPFQTLSPKPTPSTPKPETLNPKNLNPTPSP